MPEPTEQSSAEARGAAGGCDCSCHRCCVPLDEACEDCPENHEGRSVTGPALEGELVDPADQPGPALKLWELLDECAVAAAAAVGTGPASRARIDRITGAVSAAVNRCLEGSPRPDADPIAGLTDAEIIAALVAEAAVRAGMLARDVP